MAFYRRIHTRFPRTTTWGLWGLGLLALLGSWGMLYGMIGLLTEAVLVPWDWVMVGERPVVGSWQRTVIDYFESAAGWLPSRIVVAASIVLFCARFVRTRSGTRVVWFVVTNTLGSLALWNIGIIGMILPRIWLRPDLLMMAGDRGYHRTWLAGVLVLLAVLVLLTLQARERLVWPGQPLGRARRP